MDTTIKAHHLPCNIDLSDIGDLIRDFCKEVEKLEEKIEEQERLIEQLQGINERGERD